MSKETRRFIWGAFLVLVGSLALTSYVIEIRDGEWVAGFWSVTGMALSVLVGVRGVWFIEDAI